jgi:SAM-dependent methyltransferase
VSADIEAPGSAPASTGMQAEAEIDLRPLELARRSIAGDLPLHYRRKLEYEFNSRIEAAIQPGMHVLDVGSGRRPSIAPDLRGEGCTYVGLDISSHELDTAEPGSYDEGIVADVAGARLPELTDRFDLIISFQVLEHVRPLAVALENMRLYLKPGGRMIVQMSGTFTPFSLLGKVVPHTIKVRALERFLDRVPEEIFPAHYDHCWANALARMTQDWQRVEIVPLHRGAAYLHFTKPLRAGYLVYERWLAKRGYDDLAAYFLVDAVR